LTCFYNEMAQEDWVIYRDAFTNRLTIRKGMLNFREYPQKMEVSHGFSQATEDTEFPVILNKAYDRTKMLTMKMPSVAGGGACTFQIGTLNDYHGYLINGGGVLDFQALRYLGFLPGSVNVDEFKFRDYYSSPVYLYHQNDISMVSKKFLFLGASTSDGPIYVKNGIPTEVRIDYVSNKQTLEDIGNVQAHRLSDGENLIVYSAPVPEFKMGEDLNNSSDAGNKWDNPQGIFIIGTANDGLLWGCPIVKALKIGEDDTYQYPLMVLNNVDFQISLYNNMSNTLCIISKHYDETGRAYLGAFNVPIFSLVYQLEFCESTDDDVTDFLWRPPIIKTMDKNKDLITTWTKPSNYPTVLYKKELKTPDFLTRIMGHSDTNSQIKDNGITDWGIVNARMSEDGIFKLMYDDAHGIRLLFSRDQGLSWHKSEIILARDALGGLLIDDTGFIYITPFGIVMKNLGDNEFNNAYNAVEGSSAKVIEEIQGRFDNAGTILIGSGQIEPQRLTGYVDTQGVYYVFYYDNEGLLSALYSKDYFTWKIAPNF